LGRPKTVVDYFLAGAGALLVALGTGWAGYVYDKLKDVSAHGERLAVVESTMKHLDEHLEKIESQIERLFQRKDR